VSQKPNCREPSVSQRNRYAYSVPANRRLTLITAANNIKANLGC
jgi:hypothetical protein